ncbi:hypothetical protein EK0264_00510 [Epidermidibacterium keratini]|uniref:Insulinase family protein n=1 Tax=Epidermidibacterium keratini TaxID=1891644 RepID=A0A7L4YHF0_9ACTN|nr:hypothetical protein [Epidermidibacterium keratini]QHB98925.1 hypothetical protein EK0264_00510 [Epidermidibacterium keratini]
MTGPQIDSGAPAAKRAVAAPALRQNAATRSTIDGVIVLARSVGGTTRASLSFRCGAADEPLPQRGISHLIGHAASEAAGQDPAGCPVTVSASSTTFHFTGNALAVANEIGAVCHWLGAAIHPTGIDERALDRARAAAAADQRQHAEEHTSAIAARFGPAGWAGGDLTEIGLGELDRAQVAAWVARYFTRGNAVLALSGTKATTLRVPLPPGEYVDFPELPHSALQTPALIAAASPRLRVGALLRTDPATLDRDRAVAGLATEIVRSRSAYAVGQRFGREISIAGGPMALGRDHVHAALWAEVNERQEAKVADLVVEAIDSLAGDGLVDGELAAHTARRAARLSKAEANPASAHDLLTRQALGALNESPWSPALERRLVQTATADQVGEYVKQFTSSMLLSMHEVAPPIRNWSGGLPAPRFEVTAPAHKSRPAYGRDRTALARLHSDREGITIRRLDRPDRQLRWSDVVLAETWDDGRRRLTGARGQRIDVRPYRWAEPDEVVREIDARIPPETRARIGAGDDRDPAPQTLLDRIDPRGWLAMAGACALLLLLAAPPLLPASLSWVRWVLGAIGLVGLVVCGAFALETVRTERRFGTTPPAETLTKQPDS